MGHFSFCCGSAHPAKAGPMDSTIPQVFDHVLKQAFDALCGRSLPDADGDEWPVWSNQGEI
jgi:hypothetical protein